MKKLTHYLVIVFFLAMGMAVNAATVDFAVSATVPAATGVSIVATEVDSATGNFGSTVTALDFNPLTFDATNGIYLPNHFFAIDVAATGGAGNPDTVVSYAEGSKPAGQTDGLGLRTQAAFVKVTTGGEQALASHPKSTLTGIVGGESIDDTELVGGFLRVYVGIITGDDANILSQGGAPFTNGDQSGNYTGTLTVTATVT